MAEAGDQAGTANDMATTLLRSLGLQFIPAAAEMTSEAQRAAEEKERL
eukprot:CAMPEP_0182861800 /NCGR_PEP_ID=MMETSP0034_2-20130328/5697_1 /TAXON_ID=156128 /ORGANISM="Nephroselmis pyriformis, Strain CCMP717" /LENGTH=47 /DNA_ID= /DNA_START= /DNA_END= /DNA_ORIENTATION=